MHREVVWEFNTAQFRVALEISPEDMDPADSFEFEEDIEAVRNGNVEWFCARVAVYLKGQRLALGADSLGGCAYNTVAEFYTSHRDPDAMNRNCTIMRAARGDISICHYFPEMVSIAVKEARAELARIKSIALRA